MHRVLKLGKSPIFAQALSPFKTNQIYGWMNVFPILPSVMLTKFNIKVSTFENILFYWVIGFLRKWLVTRTYDFVIGLSHVRYIAIIVWLR